MKTCIRCGNVLSDDSYYCTSCGTDQRIDFKTQLPQQKQDDTFLKVLCVLTIVGACFNLISVPLSMLRPPGYSDGQLYIVQGVSFIIAITKLTGAIFMLQKKLSGLYLYTIGAVVSVGAAIWSAIRVSGSMEIGNAFAMVISLISIIFLLAFPIMYWLPVNRRLLF